MTTAIELPLMDLAAADARSAALRYVSEAFAEAVLDGIDGEAFAEAAIGAAFRELVAVHGEERAAVIAETLSQRIRTGEFSAQTRQ
jgi:hypothetical protein